jgi:hypothetical protein
VILDLAISLVIAAPWVLAWLWRRRARRERKARVMDGIVAASQQRGRSRSVLIEKAIEDDLARRRAEAAKAITNGTAQARGHK